MDFEKQISEMDEQIRKIEGKRKYLYKCHYIQSYKERMYLIGKCYKQGDFFCKIIDLDIENEYRCFILVFTKGKFDIEDIQEHYSVFRGVPFTENIGGLGMYGIEVENTMIKDLLEKAEEITPEDFKKEYLEQCEQIFDIDKFLLADRLERIEKEKNNECPY